VHGGDAVTLPDAAEPSAISAQDFGAKLSTWNSLVRRARIGRQLKGAALAVSSYANPDGSSIKCGVARLAADCEIGYSTARRYLAWLRNVGLIEMVRAGNRKAGKADEYRLILDPDVHQRLEIPDEDEYRKIIDEVNGTNQSSQKARRTRHQRSSQESANTTAPVDPSALTMSSAETGYQRSFSVPSALTQDEPPPSINTFQVDAPSTGGAPPPDPRRPQPPTASGSGTGERESPTDPVTQHQALQRNSRPRVRADQTAEPLEHIAPVIPIDSRRIS
jgi:hypothetical protein